MRGPNGETGGCYAETIAGRFSWPAQPEHEKLIFHEAGPFFGFAERGPHGARWTGKVELQAEHLLDPLRARKPTTWFISMSDWAHEVLPFETMAQIWGVAVAARESTFQFLTKRSDRMREFLTWLTDDRLVEGMLRAGVETVRVGIGPLSAECTPRAALALVGTFLPAPNVQLGVSVEMAKYKPRIDDLRASPAAIRFVSYEPLLEDLGPLDLSKINWGIAGAESGRRRRQMELDWVRHIRDQHVAQGARFFFKQAFEGKAKVSLPMLDGRRWAEMPEPIR